MGKDFYEHSSAARSIFDEAASSAGDEFLSTIFEGSAEDLAQTRIQQPALLTVEVAMARHLMACNHQPDGCAGHSLGEFSALVAAGALSFLEAFRLVQIRARLMSEDVPQGTMAAVLGLEPDTIEKVLPEGVDVANFNGPQQTIISGTVEGIAEAEARLKSAGAKRILPLPVSGPFHSRLMQPAADKFRFILSSAEIAAPRVSVISSVSGADVSDPEEIRELLSRQISAPVRWTDVMKRLGPVPALEVGPGRVLQGLAKRAENAPVIEATGSLEAANALAVS